MAVTMQSTGIEYPGGGIQTTKPEFLHPTSIGSSYGGGYYVGSLYTLGYKFYLIASPASAESSQTWGAAENVDSRQGIDGYTNTENLVNQAGKTYGAASYCWNLTLNGYDDWYLPSIYEIHQMSVVMAYLPSAQRLTGSNYWTSNFGGGAGSTGLAWILRTSGDTAQQIGFNTLPNTFFYQKINSATVRPFRRINV